MLAIEQLKPSFVQPDPGWGTLCGECDHILRQKDDFECELGQVPFTRYSPGGCDVMMNDQPLIDFVEVCFAYKQDEDANLNTDLYKHAMLWADALPYRGRIMEDVLCAAILEWVKEKFPLVRVILGYDQIMFFVDSTALYVTPHDTKLVITESKMAGNAHQKKEVGKIDLHNPNSKDELLRLVEACFGEF